MSNSNTSDAWNGPLYLMNPLIILSQRFASELVQRKDNTRFLDLELKKTLNNLSLNPLQATFMPCISNHTIGEQIL